MVVKIQNILNKMFIIVIVFMLFLVLVSRSLVTTGNEGWGERENIRGSKGEAQSGDTLEKESTYHRVEVPPVIYPEQPKMWLTDEDFGFIDEWSHSGEDDIEIEQLFNPNYRQSTEYNMVEKDFASYGIYHLESKNVTEGDSIVPSFEYLIKDDYSPRGPIRIDNNTDFAEQADDEGWSGVEHLSWYLLRRLGL